MDEDPAVNNQDGSDSSPDEIQKKGKGKNWSKREDELLIAAWVHNSCDPIDGNSKRAETYWKKVATEYNKYATKEQKKTVGQCKNHWTRPQRRLQSSMVSTMLKKVHGLVGAMTSNLWRGYVPNT